MNKIGKRKRSRNNRGATVVLVAICAFFVLLPLGLFSFEIARLYLAQNQLQNAVDAAALSAITGISDNLDDAAVSDLSLNLFRRNQITSAPLKTAALSATVDTDNPKAFDSTYNLAIDHKKGQARATGAFGYLPAFAKGLGLGPVTIRANALAGTKPVQGDIVIAVDISDSIKGGCGINNQRSNGASSKSWIVSQHKNLKGTVPLYTYTSVTKSGGKGNPPKVIAINPVHSNSPAGLHVGGNFLHAIPDPAQIDWANNSNQVYKAFANKTLEEKVALLAESKNGDLDKLGDKKFYDPKAAKPKVPHNLDKTALAPYLPEIGDGSIPAGSPGSHVYRGAYEEVALPFVHPLADEKADVESLINQIIDNNPNANIALVGFAPRAGGHFPATSKKNPTPQLPTNNIGAFGPNYGFGESCDSKLAAKNEPFVRFTNDKDELIKTVKIATT
ncbi:MAG: pilus assembly protein, partial [Candidatus Obscuribacterales bacterium]|nr:pilus assembly protein [Candidatus Obscuribacterales bacterium]